MKWIVRVVLLLLLLLPGMLSAALSQSLEKADSLKVGDLFTLRIECDFPIGKVNIPDSLSSFAIVANRAAAKDKQSWMIEIVPLSTGALSFPRLQLNPARSEQEPEYTDGFRVYVLSVLAEGDTLLRDIKPLERYPLQLPFWAYLLLLLLAIALALYLILKRTPKPGLSKNEAAPVQEPIKIAAWQEALQQLEELLAKGLLEKEAWLQLYFGLSEILRSFLEKEYHFGAMEMTVSEISTVLQHNHISNKAEVQDFLQLCDLVKFAKAEPDTSSTETRIEWLKNYLTSFKATISRGSNA